ncbi:MAG: MgtC/SapB family protein [archaeon]
MFAFIGQEYTFAIGLILSLAVGALIGAERELRGKPAGISTHAFVVGGSMIFAFISNIVDPESTSRIAAQIITGVGFLGAGIILKNDSGRITNLTTAASIWFSASIGMAIGFGMYVMALLGLGYALVVPRIPGFKKIKKTTHDINLPSPNAIPQALRKHITGKK